MTDRQKITDGHRRRWPVVYVRQSTPRQVERNAESRARQYALRERAVELGWPAASVSVVDEDLGRSGAAADGRLGFKELVGEVGLGHVGLVLALEVSRLARSSADWHQLLDLCALTGTLIADQDGIYSPQDFNDRLLLGFEGHDVGGRAATDPRQVGRRPAQQGRAGRARAESAGRARARRRRADRALGG
jgi:Resolvase, N terminal domain